MGPRRSGDLVVPDAESACTAIDFAVLRQRLLSFMARSGAAPSAFAPLVRGSERQRARCMRPVTRSPFGGRRALSMDRLNRREDESHAHAREKR